MRKGFTLIELLVVIIIIGILAAVAIPQYMTATERAKGGKAKSAMGLIAQGEKLYRAENDIYIVGATKAAINTALSAYIELDAVAVDADWNYAVTIPTTTTFTTTATRIGTGKNAGETITLTQDGVWEGTFTP